MSTLRVELFHDDEAGNWHYRVPALHINGGGTATREEAEQDCLVTINFDVITETITETSNNTNIDDDIPPRTPQAVEASRDSYRQ